ncbi:MAG TPA: tRNA (adenosine(37)-N6)-threonylcarbamoyltransferase complex transferase subunit TsaD [Clostridiales bacterium]|nr:tRNA (adenosine(37)-N6)-threonylcarbamoyltransferase complex transferase subunit TsaD [Clostridiales bacterium]
MKEGKHLTLAIETSCDETAVAVLADGHTILSNVISSQIDVHRVFGGVVPEIASRHHLKNLNPVFAAALEEAGVTLQEVDEIGVAPGPGLAGALLMGTAFAKAVAFAAQKPLVAVHHIQAHIMANLIEHPQLEPPFMALVVSGGHTHLIGVEGYNRFRIWGKTRDDAAGEAFDKVARVLELGYPGGPRIDEAARLGNPDAVPFKRVYLEKGSLDFSFSGIKTGVINYLHTQKQRGNPVNVQDVAAGFQMAVVEVLVDKAMMALEQSGYRTLVLAGGVASNSALREKLKAASDANGVELCIPSPILCTDNAAMVACAAYHKQRLGRFADLYLDVWPGLSIESGLDLLDAKPRN